MSVLERFAAKRRRDDLEATSQHPRATCLRCRREYTRDPEAERVDEYCWWCAARVGQQDAFAIVE